MEDQLPPGSWIVTKNGYEPNLADPVMAALYGSPGGSDDGGTEDEI